MGAQRNHLTETGFYEFTQHMFWLRIKKIDFQLTPFKRKGGTVLYRVPYTSARLLLNLLKMFEEIGKI